MIRELTDIIGMMREEHGGEDWYTARDAVREWLGMSLWAGNGISGALHAGGSRYIQAVQYPGENVVYNLYEGYEKVGPARRTYDISTVFIWLEI